MRNVLSVALLLFTLPLFAQPSLDYYLPQDITYDSDIPTPQSVFGYELGEWHTSHDQLLYYMRALADASDRVKLVSYARSHETRPLINLVITAPENHQNLDQIQADHLRLSDPQQSAQLDVDNMPVVLWMGYGVHGNEPSATHASILMAYYLAAGQGEKLQQQLKESVVIVDPCFNPDGFNRFVSWVNTHRGINMISDDPYDREHIEAWPRGRTNHFWFDLNRDWLLVQHPESQGRIKRFHQWKPNWLTDYHEMGTNATYFFQPGIPSRNNPLSPARVFELTEQVSRFHAKYLDKIGTLYYSRESFDDFYIGKGSTYPDINGSVGILFEQASSRGHLQSSINGPVSFPFTIRNQFTTSLSTLDGVHTLRKELLSYQRDFFKTALEEAAKDPIKAYVFGSEKDKARAWHLADLIRQHDIEVSPLSTDLTLNDQRYPAASSYMVSLNQGQYRLIKSMFEQRTTFQDSLFYDVSAWTLPLAFGLAFEGVDAAVIKRLGEEKSEVSEFPKGKAPNNKSEYAYAFEWYGYYAPRALQRLLNAGLRVKVASKTFSGSGNHTFVPGSILVPVANQNLNADEIYRLVQTIGKEDALEVHALSGGQSGNGVDLGSGSFSLISPRKVLLIVGDGISSYEAGEVWHVLDQRYHVPVSKVTISALSRVNFDNYTTIIMPNGNYSALKGSTLTRLKTWVGKGGDIVAWKSALNWLNAQGMINFSTPSQASDTTFKALPYNEQRSRRGAQAIGGAIFEVKLDLTHPLAYGYEREHLSVFRNHRLFIKPEHRPYAFPAIYTEAPLMAGYISDENLKLLSGTAAAMVNRWERGKIICLTDNPNFRAFWYGTNKLMMNAIYFADAI